MLIKILQKGIQKSEIWLICSLDQIGFIFQTSHSRKPLYLHMSAFSVTIATKSFLGLKMNTLGNIGILKAK